MKVAYALWACLTIAIVTSGHETAVETLDPEEVAVPVFKREHRSCFAFSVV